MKKLTKYLSVGLLVAASAASFTVNAAIVELGNLSGTYANTFERSAGAFIDNIKFSITTPSNLGSAANHLDLSFNIPGIGNVDLYNITGMYYNITGPGSFTTGTLSADNTTHSTILNVAGDYQVNLFGNATGTKVGLYAVALNVTAVPEPETYALMLAGLGLVGFAARRRKSAV